MGKFSHEFFKSHHRLHARSHPHENECIHTHSQRNHHHLISIYWRCDAMGEEITFSYSNFYSGDVRGTHGVSAQQRRVIMLS